MAHRWTVLILVVVDDGLVLTRVFEPAGTEVLILVVVDDGLVHVEN